MKPLFWIDLEMTGLDETADVILEVAVIITDMDFSILDEYHSIVYQPQDVLDRMNDWCKKTHGESGLTEAVKSGTSLVKVEADMVQLIGKHYPANKKVVLCGNSVGNDKRFLDKYMPILAKRLHYRIIDVTSFKEIFREKYGIEPKKKGSHRAIDDIKESIEELKTYLSYVKVPEGAKAK